MKAGACSRRPSSRSRAFCASMAAAELWSRSCFSALTSRTSTTAIRVGAAPNGPKESSMAKRSSAFRIPYESRNTSGSSGASGVVERPARASQQADRHSGVSSAWSEAPTSSALGTPNIRWHCALANRMPPFASTTNIALGAASRAAQAMVASPLRSATFVRPSSIPHQPPATFRRKVSIRLHGQIEGGAKA